jgi:hypothetical protein
VPHLTCSLLHAHILGHADRMHPTNGAYKIMPSYVHNELFLVKFPDRSELGSRIKTDKNGKLYILQRDLRQMEALVLRIWLSHKKEACLQSRTLHNSTPSRCIYHQHMHNRKYTRDYEY